MTTPFEKITAVINAHLTELQKPGVLSVRPGFEFTNHWITGRAAIVATVDVKKAPGALSPADLLPTSIGGFPVDVHQATPLQAQRLKDPAQFLKEAARLVPEQRPAAPPMEQTPTGVAVTTPVHGLLPHSKEPHIDYTAAAGHPLKPVTATVTIECVASPDQGWPRLHEFLSATKHTLTVGLYDFTSAHVANAVRTAMHGKDLKLVLAHPATNPTADQTDEQTVTALANDLGHRFALAWALDNHDTLADAWIYPSAYHIKVAVRDSATVWLSSGNWNNSNQPDIDPVANPADGGEARTRDRDWHLIIDHRGIAKLFEAYLAHDFEVAQPHSKPIPTPPAPLNAAAGNAAAPAGTPPFAQFFAAKTVTGPMTLTPLLTPDPGVYVDAVTELVSSATRTLYLQYQYVQPNPAPDAAAFQKLIKAVIARHKAGVDVRLIVSKHQTRENLEALQNLGLDVVNQVRIQANVHNKGIVVDGTRVLVSSQNWSGAGVLQNRDAGIIVDQPDIARYFEQIFLHDWDTLSDQKVGP